MAYLLAGKTDRGLGKAKPSKTPSTNMIAQ